MFLAGLVIGIFAFGIIPSSFPVYVKDGKLEHFTLERGLLPQIYT